MISRVQANILPLADLRERDTSCHFTGIGFVRERPFDLLLVILRLTLQV